MVQARFQNQTSRLVRLTVGEEVIWTTPEHPFWVNNTWVVAKDITTGDSVSRFSKAELAVTGTRLFDSTVTVYNFTVSDFHTYYVSAFGILVHNDCIFAWQKNKAMNDVLSKSIHGDVFNSKGVKVGEVGFELENGVITPKALGKDLSKDMRAYIEKVGNNQLQTPGFQNSLLNKVNEALNSGQIPASNRLEKLQEMQRILTPPAPAQ